MKNDSLYKGGLVLLAGFIVLKLGGVAFRIICMNMLSVESYGQVALFLILFNWFVLFATFNVTLGMTKFVSQDPKKKRAYYTAALLGSLVIALVISGALTIAAPALSALINIDPGVVYWAILAIPFAVVYNMGIFYFRGIYDMRSSTLTDAGMTIARITMLVFLLYAGFQYAPFLAFVLSFVIADIFLVIRNRKVMDRGSEISATFKTMLVYSFPIFLSEFLRQFSMNLDRVVISGFYSATEAGFYDVGVALCIGYLIIANSYSNALLPKASSSQSDARKRRKELLRALKASAALFALYTALLLLLGQAVINIINPAYIEVFEFILPLSAAYMLLGFLTILFFFANSIGKQKYAVYAGAVFAFLSVTLNVYLVPIEMYTGAINALIASSAASIAVIGALIWNLERSRS